MASTNTMLTEIYIDVLERITAVEISIEKLDEKPETIATPIPSVYRYISITKKNLEDDNIESAHVKFKVEKSWIEDNSIDRSTLALYRYSNNQWNKLPTRQTDSDNDYLYFKATVPGFSYFAIMAESTVPATTIISTTTTQITGETTTTTTTIIILPFLSDINQRELKGWIIVAFAVMIPAAVIIMARKALLKRRRRRRRKTKKKSKKKKRSFN